MLLPPFFLVYTTYSIKLGGWGTAFFYISFLQFFTIFLLLTSIFMIVWDRGEATFSAFLVFFYRLLIVQLYAFFGTAC